ncbi:hypothetical protein [Methylobacterium sp. WL120]|uniref:hypothetical protein n=1 Tax=Methylobacterium sp. WL120 TaxID=2603887 RepID=UPI0011CB5044|nr:hypothetical protein [Methylobacterium sp. WL120]TXM65200.1 hypothetical protein FV229_16370 [Methylobacterium sp. WL120]
MLDEFLLAPEDAFFIHLDWVFRSLPERREKLASYERQRAGRASISSSSTRPSCTIRGTGA